jgi:transcription-repair coupling factor (superfamily II helicase)
MSIDFAKNLKKNLSVTADSDTKALLFDNSNASFEAFLLAHIIKETKKNIFVITTDLKKDVLFENLLFFGINPLDFPAKESYISSAISSNTDTIGKRMETLHTLSNTDNPNIVLGSFFSLTQKVPAIKELKKSSLIWKINDTISFKTLFDLLTSYGYQHKSLVCDKGDFALRCGILDIFPSSSSSPYRIEFFGDDISSIRLFDPSSQKSLEKVEKIIIYPAKEQALESTILDYLDNDTIIFFSDLLALEDSYVKLKIPFSSINADIKNFVKIFSAKENIEELSKISTLKSLDTLEEISFNLFNEELKTYRFKQPITIPYDDLLFDKKVTINLVYETDREKQLLEDTFKDHENKCWQKGYISEGFFLPFFYFALIPAATLTHRQKLRRQVCRNIIYNPQEEYHNLEVNDIVVHFHSGIGKYLGIEKQKNNLGEVAEHLVIEYAQNSKLYVPISQAHLVSRYIGGDEASYTLSSLGSTKWQHTKVAAEKKITGYAKDLLQLYAERNVKGGIVFPQDSDEQKLFELEFPYSVTVDQMKAIEDVKKDMESSRAMDRLICGDVGYGKTEVAIRAAFKAAFDGKKQVAVLVPTTVLAQQHYETFSKRMSSFPLVIEVLSRFNTNKKNKEIIQMVAEGKVDIIIGTHRMLSQDMRFHDLGLLIIDEEQRFGVRAKEKLKKLKVNIDCITMSATPIPRTLYTSLIKVKDLSVISTPPQDRLPIRTIIAQDNDELIKNAILEEMTREGQIFFIHNRVETIYKKEEFLQKLIPTATILTVHGQMEMDKLDELFHKFKQNEADILLTTTIVENGVDIPNANTIIIDRADTFGLADLYQLRGRVGRWNRLAYAYFLTPKKEISEPSQKRLKALLESGGFGGGMKIAMRDLEIRGAGDILGVQQSGQITAIGFHLYCKLLRKAIEGLETNKEIIFNEAKVEFSYPAFLPEEYISDTALRMEFYHKMGNASLKQLDMIMEEMKDRFGPIPAEVKWLCHLSRVKLFANVNNFTSLKINTFTLQACQMLENKKTLCKTMMFKCKFKTAEEFELETIRALKDNFICLSVP